MCALPSLRLSSCFLQLLSPLSLSALLDPSLTPTRNNQTTIEQWHGHSDKTTTHFVACAQKREPPPPTAGSKPQTNRPPTTPTNCAHLFCRTRAPTCRLASSGFQRVQLHPRHPNATSNTLGRLPDIAAFFTPSPSTAGNSPTGDGLGSVPNRVNFAEVTISWSLQANFTRMTIPALAQPCEFR